MPTVMVPLLVLAIPFLDVVLAVLRRTWRGKGIGTADKEHIHHRLMRHLALSHRSTVLALYGLSSVFTLAALGLAYANSTRCAIVLCAVAVVVIVVMRNLGSSSLCESHTQMSKHGTGQSEIPAKGLQDLTWRRS